MATTATEIRFEVNGLVSSDQLNALYDASWPAHVTMDFAPLLPHYLAYVCAYDGIRLIGWVYLAWDGWQHAFLLDPTVHPEYRRLGIGRELVRLAANAARQARCEWLHVDYEAELAPFYEACGFEPAAAGLIRLT
jgi:ribosomal protein S18 acetylase RimI-like enzyme